VDSKAEYSALSSTRSQKKKLKQTTSYSHFHGNPMETFLTQVFNLFVFAISGCKLVGN